MGRRCLRRVGRVVESWGKGAGIVGAGIGRKYRYGSAYARMFRIRGADLG